MIEGIDLSHWNGAVDPRKVLAAGKQFVVHQLTDGIGSPDPAAKANVTAFRDEGLDAQGGYHYLEIRHGRAQDAEAQAGEFFSRVVDLKLRFVWLDVELGGLPIAAQNILANEHADKSGVYAEVREAALAFYSSYMDWVAGTAAPQKLTTYGSPGEMGMMGVTKIAELAATSLAVAHYTKGAPTIVLPWTNWTFHQYAGDVGNIGTCPGVSSPHCDLDRFNGTVEDLIAT